MTTWIERTARRKSIGQVVLFLVVTAIVAWILAENSAYWKVFFHGLSTYMRWFSTQPFTVLAYIGHPAGQAQADADAEKLTSLSKISKQ